MKDIINRQAAIAMVEKIVDEIEQLTVGSDEKKTWATALMNTILPAEVFTKYEANKISKIFQNYYCMGITEIAEEDEVCESIFEKVGLIKIIEP